MIDVTSSLALCRPPVPNRARNGDKAPSKCVVVDDNGDSARKMDKSESESFLHSLLNKNFRVLATDGRIFRGQFKCTDPVSLAAPNQRACPRINQA